MIESSEKERCAWVTDDTLYQKYHDEEWGVPVYDDAVLFEFLVLETFQAGLSWITILKKRENFRKAFDNFNYQKIANYQDEKIAKLYSNKEIIRNRLKIKSVVTNARAFMKVQKEFGSFSTYIWSFVNDKPIQNHFAEKSEVPVTTFLSDIIAKDLKKRGFSFVGSTITYAFMQSIGMVNDHTKNCFKYYTKN